MKLIYRSRVSAKHLPRSLIIKLMEADLSSFVILIIHELQRETTSNQSHFIKSTITRLE